MTKAEAETLRTLFHEAGEFQAAVELRRLYPGISTTTRALECVRIIAGWAPLPAPPAPPKGKVVKFRPRRPGRPPAAS